MNTQQAKQDEKRLFFMTTVVFMPLAALSLVGAFGFIAWFSQSLFS